MSYNIDGKVVNQAPKTKSGKVLCAKCNKILLHPEYAVLKPAESNTTYYIRHYLGKDFFIYETKSGKAVTYCSEYCKKKHNHRFKV